MAYYGNYTSGSKKIRMLIDANLIVAVSGSVVFLLAIFCCIVLVTLAGLINFFFKSRKSKCNKN